ncbi:hypothetical protein ACFVVA_23585 [Kitasatospora sp. NPDC058048]|uniref:hypothetical protein n=1 Tax=Kitasatospora sp. NPDC058048 TaxID=3346313 RepID=UPI0036D9172A
MVRTGFRCILDAEPDIDAVAEAGDGIEAVRAAARGEAMGSPQVTVRLLRHFTSRRARPPLPGADRHPLSDREPATVRAAAMASPTTGSPTACTSPSGRSGRTLPPHG